MCANRNRIVLPKNVRLSDSAWSEVIAQVCSDVEDLHFFESLMGILDSPEVPEHLKTDNLRNQVKWLQFKYRLPHLTKFEGSSVGGAFFLDKDGITEMYEWLSNPEQADILSRAKEEIVGILKRVPPDPLVPSWIERIQALNTTATS